MFPCALDREPSGKTGTVVGWGRLSEGGNLADIVQEVQVPILSLAQCRATKYRPQRITANMICAGKGVEDSCQVMYSYFYPQKCVIIENLNKWLRVRWRDYERVFRSEVIRN